MVSAVQIVDGDLLRAFAAFAETANFTHAAQRIHLSQPALFERVKRLEELTGASLYERAGKSLRLTDAGRHLAAYARDTLARGDAFLHELHGGPSRGAVTLAAGEGAYLYLLGAAIERFVAASDATLNVLTLGAARVVEAVLSGEADLGVTVLDPVPHGLVSQDIVRAPMCAALSRKHPLAKKAAIRLADLARSRLVLPPTGRLYRDLVARFVAMAGDDLDAPIEADGWPLMLELVRVGLGVAIVNGTCKPPRGVVLRPLGELGSVRYRLLVRRGAELSDAAETLASLLRETPREPSLPS